MNTADLTALRELHRLISRQHSVHEKFAAPLARAIGELAGEAPPEYVTLGPGESYGCVTNKGAGSFRVPAHWPLPMDGDE